MKSFLIVQINTKADLLEFLGGLFQTVDELLVGDAEEVGVQIETLLDVAFGLGQMGFCPVQPQSQQAKLILVLLPALDPIAEMSVVVIGIVRHFFQAMAQFFQFLSIFCRSTVVGGALNSQ